MMLAKWKSILINWINCYPNDTVIHDLSSLNLDSLLKIISHLRENLCLDESKSSILEAHTLEEFIREKYPDFVFDNGSADAWTQEELYIAASLLLLFVCVNSKDVDLKTAMCSRLSSGDQETILKFSKFLMDCSSVSQKDIENAILESCGQDTASCQEPECQSMVTETPPALRSLHGEVRRLNAALDAERFDKNYLQEELSRTQHKIEKLLKEKEQHKQDILNLRAKVSDCCGDEAHARAEGQGDNSTQKLLRQIDDLEQRLVDTRAQLDEVQYERDAYRVKIDELKLERDKWLSFGQQESSRAIQLAEQVELERRNVESLRELVNELRQHHRYNGLDGSQLECDDPDMSVQSLGQNVSICNEACANVVEVQLAEERAKAVELKQQIQALQDQINDLNRRALEEKLTLENILQEKDADLMNLKHRVNEEIEDKNNIKSFYSNEVSQLNNEMNELEQKMRSDNDNYAKTIAEKMKDIQTVQEEKLTLLQSLSDETTKLENIIKDREATIQTLTSDLDAERKSKQKMKEDYENHIMKLNEKVLNRNNELVELQNNVFEKSEMIETINAELRKLKENKEEMTVAFESEITRLQGVISETDTALKVKNEELEELRQKLIVESETIVSLKNELQSLVAVKGDLETELNMLNATKAHLENDITTRDELLQDHRNKIYDIEITLREKTESSHRELQEKGVIISNLETQLQLETNYKIHLQNELSQLNEARSHLIEEFHSLKNDFIKLQQELQEKSRMVDSMDLYLKEQKELHNKLRCECESLKENIKCLYDSIEEKDSQLISCQEEIKNRDNDIHTKDAIILKANNQINVDATEKETLSKIIDSLNEEKEKWITESSEKSQELNCAKMECSKLIHIVDENKTVIKTLENAIKAQESKIVEVQDLFNKETLMLSNKISESEKSLYKLKTDFDMNMNNKIKDIQNLQSEFLHVKEEKITLEEKIISLKQQHNDLNAEKDAEIKELKGRIDKIISEFNLLEQKMKQDNDSKDKTIEEIQNENKKLLHNIEEHNSKHEVLLKEKHAILQRLQTITEKLTSIEKDYTEETVLRENLTTEMKDLLKSKNSKLAHLEGELVQAKKSLEESIMEIVKVKEDSESKLSLLTKEKDDIIEKLTMEITTLNSMISAKDNVLKEIINEKDSLSNALEENKIKTNALIIEKEELLKQGLELESLEKEKEDLIKAQNILQQQLKQEIQAKKILKKQNETLADTKEKISLKLMEELAGNELLLKERKAATKELDKLANKLAHEKASNEALMHENEDLITKMREELADKENLKSDYENLTIVNHDLMRKVSETNTHCDLLLQEKNVFMVEKEALINNLTEEKAARDEIESEKLKEETKSQEIKQNYEREIKNKNEEITKLIYELKTAQENCNEKEKSVAILSKTLNAGLGRLLMKLRNEDINNEVLQKLISIDKYEDIPTSDQCHLLVNIAETLTTDLSVRKNLELALQHENSALSEFRDIVKNKELQLHDVQIECKQLMQSLSDVHDELKRQNKAYIDTVDEKTKALKNLEQENTSLKDELTDVKIQLELKVHSLKEKLVDNEHLTEKLKKAYESQIENLNIMSNKLTKYLMEKNIELEGVRKDKDKLQAIIDNNNKVIQGLEDEVKLQTAKQEALINDFDNERQVLKNMVTVTESVMEDMKSTLEKQISEHVKACENLQKENQLLKETIENDKINSDLAIKEKDTAFNILFKELSDDRTAKELLQKEFECIILSLKEEISAKSSVIVNLEKQSTEFEKVKNDLAEINENYTEVLAVKDELEKLLQDKEAELKKTLNQLTERETAFITEINNKNHEIQQLKEINSDIGEKVKSAEQILQNKETELIKGNEEISTKLNQLELQVHDKDNEIKEFINKMNHITDKLKICNDEIALLNKEKQVLAQEKEDLEQKLEVLKLSNDSAKDREELVKLQKENSHLANTIEENKSVIANLEQLVKHEIEQNQQLREDTLREKLNLINKCSLLEQYQSKAEKELEERNKEITSLQMEINTLKCHADIAKKEHTFPISKEMAEERIAREKFLKELGFDNMYELKQKINQLVELKDTMVKKEKEQLSKMFAPHVAPGVPASSTQYPGHEHRDNHTQVDISPPTFIHSSDDSNKTITDLERIIHDKNRTITTLQSDISYMKTLMAESENKLLDVTKDLDVSKENCLQLSMQLKKLVNMKNEEIAEMKKQLSKMSVAENRASQIIKVSAKYQAIILKRVAEIKSNTVLKELTNFGNGNNVDNELRRSLAGSITMEDLENFLETTDRHLKRCSEKQISLQKERDRLLEVNRINESEIVNMQKFLTELSLSYKTFISVKDVYAQKLSRVVSIQRTVRREILNLDGHVTDAAMCKLERSYTAVMPDLSECAMNLERWVERCVSRTISPEKIKQAYTSEVDGVSLTSSSFQNTSMEVQLDELEKSFKKVLEEAMRASKGEGARDVQSVTVMEVRAEYEDKLNRMKAKMKQLYQEQITIFRDKQKEEIGVLERELEKAREKLAESSRSYEEHIRRLTMELWSVGEKVLVKNEEAQWLRRKQSGSLQSLQHVHSSGLLPREDYRTRPSDASSLRSLPVHKSGKEKSGRGLHMSDEEGEVFDNRWLPSLETPRRSPPPGARLSELRYRNSLCPPHLKSSYPAETQFVPMQEDDIKLSSVGVKGQRKEVGITAYKKPGPPTPSKQAGRLSATDSELRESLRPEPSEVHHPRKTSTPSRLRALFRSSKTESVDGTPRSRRLSIFRSKK